jgi:prevent-host-death family protein
MEKQYSIANARANLSAICNEVEAGGEIALTRRGKPVAVVISCRRYARLLSDRPTFRDRYRAYLDRFCLEEIGVDHDYFDAVRDAT